MKFLCELEDLKSRKIFKDLRFFYCENNKVEGFYFCKVSPKTVKVKVLIATMKFVDAKNLSLVFTVNEFVMK